MWQNYMVLRGLHLYYKDMDPQVTDVYNQIRDFLLANTKAQYEKTGALWEYYDDRTGEGKGLPNFGWTSLIVLIEKEQYV